ncbi:MAG TPA: hypothetical protein PLO67_14800 [Saprospiraceae bacterium]|nr:hypothetical protein [Saprospiraceae bacterium]
MQDTKIFENQIEFEVLSSNSEEAIFKRIIDHSNLNGISLSNQEATTTLHFFDPEDLARLKEIEKDLISKMQLKNNKKGLWESISDFLGA